MKTIKSIVSLVLVLMASYVFAETERVISPKNQYGGKTVEVKKDTATMGVTKVVTYYDPDGKKARCDLYLDGRNIWRAHKVTTYYDVNETKLFEEHFDENGAPVQDSMGWRYFGSTFEAGDFYYRARDILRLPGNKIRVWCKVRLSKRMVSDIAAQYGAKADGLSYIESLYEIDSAARRYTERSIRLRDKAGRLITSETPEEHELVWDPISRGAPIESLFNIVQGRKR